MGANFIELEIYDVFLACVMKNLLTYKNMLNNIMNCWKFLPNFDKVRNQPYRLDIKL